MAELDEQSIAVVVAGDLDALAARLKAALEQARLRGPGGETLLHIAARQWPKLANGAEIAGALIAAGADVNEADEDGLRPIHGATGDPVLTRVLLEAGAKTAVYAVTHMNMSPAETCLYYGLPGEARLMVEHGAPVDLRIAAGIGDRDALRGFLGRDDAFRADAVGLPGQPGPRLTVAEGVAQALSYASRNGQLEAANFLLDHGANIDALAPHFDVACAPLHQAVAGGHPAVAAFLIARGARRDIRDDTHNATPLECAMHQEKAELVAILEA